MNLGNPGEFTMLELAETDHEGRLGDGSISSASRCPPTTRKRRCPDIAKARRLLGFEPKVPLESGLRQTAEDFRRRLDLK